MSKFNYPKINIVIVTFNSKRTLELTLSSIRKQNYPQINIEIMIIDGGSTDKTKEIAKKYNCKIIDKPNTEVIYRKHLGFIKSSGKYLVYLDGDESLENPQSLKMKYSAFLENPLVKCVISEGFKTPKQATFINDYSNEFGDPFSFYLYRESYSDRFLIKERKKKYKFLKENSRYIIFDMNSNQSSLVEPWAGGSMIDLEYVKATFPSIKKSPELIPLLFYLLKTEGKLLAITKNDAIIHDSSTSFREYLKKISSRIKNNVFQTEMGKGGFGGREQFQSWPYNFKKFFFPIYAFSLLLPLIDSILLSISRKRLSYLIHFLLSVYTAALIIYFMSLKMIGHRPKIGMYGS
ncbi:glycosyltransferase family 2 protein [Patescibacteria group bacterium]|nr:glycosyltransferase family 2 protein [Patescibacteria group bacterium]